MPDFFTRLAERTLGLANTIQPVLPSRFAPGAPVIDAGVQPEQDVTIEESAPQPERATPRSIDEHVEEQSTPAHPHHDRQSTPRSVVHQPGQRPAPTVERVAPAQPHVDPAPEDRPSHAVPPAEPRQQIEHHAESAQQIVRRPAPVTPADPRQFEPAARRAERPRLLDAPEPVPSVRSSEQRPTIERQIVSAEPRSQALALDDRHDPGASRATLLPLADERQAVRSQPQESTTTPERRELVGREHNPQLPGATPRTIEPPAAQAGPQIHVSIGRIEVRAVTPPPASVSKPTPAPTPRMSLDDYLRSPNGDRR